MPPSPAPLARQLLSPRRLDIGEHLASVLLAILIAHLAGAENVNWAAFAGYMVLRGHVGDTLRRGMMRVIGTLAGGLLALLLVPAVVGAWPLQAAALFVLGSAFLYGSIVGRSAYAWLFAGLTFAMVLFDKVEHPSIAIDAFVRTRMIETLAGTLACVAVGLLAAFTLRRLWPAQREPVPPPLHWHPDAARHAVQCGIALAVLAFIAAWVEVPGLAQAPITIMAVMLVPANAIGASGLTPVSRRIGDRFLGCIGGAAFAACVILLAGGSAPILLTGAALGVVIGRVIETGQHGRRYAGTQFVLAVLVVLVPDSFANAHLTPDWERLLGILIGMLVLEPVLLLWHGIAPWVQRWRRQAPAR